MSFIDGTAADLLRFAAWLGRQSLLVRRLVIAAITALLTILIAPTLMNLLVG